MYLYKLQIWYRPTNYVITHPMRMKALREVRQTKQSSTNRRDYCGARGAQAWELLCEESHQRVCEERAVMI
jgi:hypothetical protein